VEYTMEHFLRPRNSKESDPLRQDHPNIIKLYESFEDLRHSSFILQSKHVSSWLNYSTRECPIGDLRFYIHISRSVRWNCQCKRCMSEIWNTSWNCAHWHARNIQSTFVFSALTSTRKSHGSVFCHWSSIQRSVDKRFGQDSSNEFARAVWCVGSLVLTRE